MRPDNDWWGRWESVNAQLEKAAAPEGGAAIDRRDGGILVHRIIARQGLSCVLACKSPDDFCRYDLYPDGDRPNAPIRRVHRDVDCMACIAASEAS